MRNNKLDNDIGDRKVAYYFAYMSWGSVPQIVLGRSVSRYFAETA